MARSKRFPEILEDPMRNGRVILLERSLEAQRVSKL